MKKTENDIKLLGLKQYRDLIVKDIRICLNKLQNTYNITVFDLNNLSIMMSDYRQELAEVDSNIKSLEPVFNSDDIPF